MKQEIKERIEQIKQGLLPSGYKQTPVGILPSDWKLSTLSSISKFIGGGTPSTKKREYWNGEIPWISSSDVVEDNIYKISISRKINQNAINNSATKLIPSNSVLVVTRVGVGKVVVNKFPLCTSQDYTNIVEFSHDSIFLAYYLKNLINKKLQGLQGTSIKGITTKELSSFLVLDFKIKEQQKIAEVLTTWDNAVELQEKKIEKLQEKKKALMQTLLTNNDYEKMSLQELIDDNYFRLIKPKELNQYNGQKIYLSTSSIINDKIVSNEGFYEFDERPSRAQMLPLINSVWFAKLENSIKVLLADEELESNYILSTGFYGFMPIQNLVPQYLKQVFLSDYFNKQKDMFAEGSSQNGIKDKNLSDIYIYIPNYQDQKEIAKILEAFDKKLELEQKLLEKYKEQRKALMQLLLTGIVRV